MPDLARRVVTADDAHRDRLRWLSAIADHADRIVAVSEFLKAVLIRNGVAAEKIVVCRQGVERGGEPRRPIAGTREPGVLKVGFVGRFDPLKGLDVLLDAAERIPPDARIEFHVWGAARIPAARAYRDEIIRNAQGLRNVVFHGEATSAAPYDMVDILAVPSTCYETGPFVVLEAHAAGIPVVGSNLGGIAERVTAGRDGLLFPMGDARALARHPARALAGPRKTRAAAAHGSGADDRRRRARNAGHLRRACRGEGGVMTSPSTRRRLLVGTSAHNSHVQNMVRALYQTGSLYAYFSGGVDVWRGSTLRRVREWVGNGLPPLGRELSRRSVCGIPNDLVRSRWRWELPRVIAGRFSAAMRVEDWLWERGEHDLDWLCASVLRDPEVGGFFGVEHGALAAIRAAQGLGKPAILAFLSPHHRTRERWVDAEFDRQPELGTPGRARLDHLSDERDARRDDEAALADWVVSGSSFTTRSLVDAGIAPDRILTIPLGGPEPVPVSSLPSAPPRTMRFIYVGPVSVRKGAHYLLRAWRQMTARGVELHFYGKPLLPDALLAEAQAGPGGDRIVIHGSVPASTLESGLPRRQPARAADALRRLRAGGIGRARARPAGAHDRKRRCRRLRGARQERLCDSARRRAGARGMSVLVRQSPAGPVAHAIARIEPRLGVDVGALPSRVCRLGARGRRRAGAADVSGPWPEPMTDPLRIFVTADPELPVPPRLYGGIERVIALLVEGLVARGHAVTLFGHADSKVSADLVAYSGHRSGSAADTMMNAAQIAIEAARRHPDVIHSFGRLAYLLPVMPLPIPKIMSYQRAVTKRSVELGTRLSRGTLYFTACSRQLMRDVDGPAWQVIYNGVSTDALPVRAGRLDRTRR